MHLTPASPEDERRAELAREFIALKTAADRLGIRVDVILRPGGGIDYWPILPPSRGGELVAVRAALIDAVAAAHGEDRLPVNGIDSDPYPITA